MISQQRDIAAQLGRELRADSAVVARCHLGLPVVVEVPPVLIDGTPFPTRFWLSCPLAVRRLGRRESVGEIKALEARAQTESGFGERLAAAHARHEIDREALIPAKAEHRPSGGIGGSTIGVKCLHAHYADFLAGRETGLNWDSPVGELMAAAVEPLDCEMPCVIDGERNPEWREVRR